MAAVPPRSTSPCFFSDDPPPTANPQDQDSLECINQDDHAHLGSFDFDRVIRNYGLKELEIQFLKTLIITPAQQKEIRHAPQKSAKWLEARVNRITASNFGGATNHSPYSTASKTAQDMLFPKRFNNNAKALVYGNVNESVAEKQYIRYMRSTPGRASPQSFHVSHAGLIVPVQFPWTGISVDGFVFDDTMPEDFKYGGLEIKAPYSKGLYDYIPPQYYDQIQGAMGFLGLPWWDFVVWTPTKTQIRRFPFNKLYFEEALMPELERFYMLRFLPQRVATLNQAQTFQNHVSSARDVIIVHSNAPSKTNQEIIQQAQQSLGQRKYTQVQNIYARSDDCSIMFHS